ncbi:MAG: response regulator transcription factor [Pseudomonas sp.]|jgi:DNA-binding response OmpR family regulator|nr:MAG: response regulator transcription factor [Pseudomonas sp.]
MMRKIRSMANSRPRVALIAVTPRSREYGRRALRVLGCTPLVFMDVDEFLQIGERARSLSMMLLEHPVPSRASDADADPTDAGEKIRQAVGDELPVVHSVAVQTGGAIPAFRAGDMLLPGSLSFAQLCRTLRGFLKKHDLPSIESILEWGVYRFCVDSGLVYIGGKPVSLKAEEFDLALELFFNAGSKVSRPWLRAMIPSLQTLRRRPNAPAADATLLRVRDLLDLQTQHGWHLQLSPGSSCTLVRSDCLV